MFKPSEDDNKDAPSKNPLLHSLLAASSGHFVSGTCVGIKTNEKTNRKTGELILEVFIGIKSLKQNGYDDEFNYTDVKLARRVVEDGYQHLNKYKDKHIFVPVNSMSRAYNGAVYTDTYLDTARQVIEIGNAGA